MKDSTKMDMFGAVGKFSLRYAPITKTYLFNIDSLKPHF